MGQVKLTPAGEYSVVEVNRLAASRTGNLVTQYPLDGTDFATIPAENGMLLRVDHVGKKVLLPDAVTDKVFLHYSVEKLYDGEGRNKFAVKTGTFLPRLGALDANDIIETNAIVWDDVTYADFAAVKAAIDATTVFAIPSTSGYIELKAATTATAVVEFKVVEAVKLPNGRDGLKLACLRG
jgi:hypothetical protein